MKITLLAFMTSVLLWGQGLGASLLVSTDISKTDYDTLITSAEAEGRVAASGIIRAGYSSTDYGAYEILIARSMAYPVLGRANTAFGDIPERPGLEWWTKPTTPITIEYDAAGNFGIFILGSGAEVPLLDWYNAVLVEVRAQLGFPGAGDLVGLEDTTVNGMTVPSMLAIGDYGHPSYSRMLIRSEDGSPIDLLEINSMLRVGNWPGGDDFTVTYTLLKDPTIMVPEPSGIMLAGISILSLAFFRKRL